MEHFQTFLEALSHSIQFFKGQFYGAQFLLVFSTSLKIFEFSQAFDWCILVFQVLIENYWTSIKH